MMANLLNILFLYWKILPSLLSIFLPLFPSIGPHRCVIPNADCGYQLQVITASLHGKRWNNLATALGKSIASAKDEAHSVKSDIFDSTLRNLGCFLYIESFASARVASKSICDEFARNTSLNKLHWPSVSDEFVIAHCAWLLCKCEDIDVEEWEVCIMPLYDSLMWIISNLHYFLLINALN